MNEQLQATNAELLQENEQLKQKIALLETTTKNGDREREKFFEGASWNAKQAVKACDDGIAKNTKAGEEYKLKLKENQNWQ